MLRTLAISSFLFAGAVSVASADVYRWVDDHGGVHYSDQWVPGSQLIKSTKPRPSDSTSARRASSESPKPTPTPASTSTNSDDRSAVDAMKQDKAKIREEQCKTAKERYNKAIEARRIYKGSGKDKNNESDDAPREYLSDEEADAYRVKARQEMQDFCGEAPK